MVRTMQNQKIRSNVYLDKELKKQAKEMFKSYGLSLSDGINFLMKNAIDNKTPTLDIEQVSPNDPDYKIMKEAKTGDTISLDEFMKL
ncbi:MAG: type II toxin-antitoxin system antitoxin, RelB/DinJ family [Arcobacter sp.]|nr:MAG: type II toxin-antitoxin system antitoxin, RelB/DinJ family [Arcobacter sp.]